MKKRLGMLLATLFVVMISVFGQKPVISFNEREHDFGQVVEQNGKVSYVFEFTNKGTTPLIVQRVQASCGCTTPDWTKEPVEPGKKGTVVATYNPQGRPGPFTKTITVYSNASNETEMLLIRGNVVTEPALQMGGLKYSNKAIQMNFINKGKSQTSSVDVKNVSNANIKIDVANLPGYITASATPSTLKPGEDGKINFTFNTANASVWGPVNDDVYVVLNGKKTLTDEFKISVAANIIEDFANLTVADKRNAPIFGIKSPNIFFGQITKGHIVSGKIMITNAGINTLEIRRIINNNGEITVHPATLSVKGGKTGYLKVTINTKALSAGEYKKTFTLQTNDPQNQYVVINPSWNVK